MDDETTDPARAAFHAEMERFELRSQENRLSFVAAALMGAEQIAAAIDAELGKAISVVVLRALAVRNRTRQQLRDLTATESAPQKGTPHETRSNRPAAGRVRNGTRRVRVQ
jgi:hypothetical protein